MTTVVLGFIGGHCEVKFDDNQAMHDGGAMYYYGHSEMLFQGNTTVICNRNHANENGGAVDFYLKSNNAFEGNSEVTFRNNFGKFGGALHSTNGSGLLYHFKLFLLQHPKECYNSNVRMLK